MQWELFMALQNTSTAGEIYIASVIDSGIVLPGFWLEKVIEIGRSGHENHMRAVDYTYRGLPMLSELMHAFNGKFNGSWISPEYRRSIIPGHGGFTLTLIENGKFLVIPEAILYDGVNDRWVAEGKKIPVESPPSDATLNRKILKR